MSSVKKFALHYSHFLTGSLLIQLLGLISFPIVTRVLTVEQYGILGLITTTMFLMLCFAKAGLSDGIIRFYKQYNTSREKLTEFASTIVIRGLILSGAVTLVFILAFPSVGRILNISQEYYLYFMIMAAYLFVRPLNIIVMNVLRIAEKTVFYNVVNVISKILSLGLSLSLLIYIIEDFYGYFIGLVIAEFIVFFILFRWFLSRHKVVPTAVSGDLAVRLMKFGAPLLLTELSFLLLTYIDRYMIIAYMGEGALGVYSVGSNLASYVTEILMFSLSYSVIPIYIGIYEKEGKEKTEVFLSRCMHYILIAVFAVVAGFTATLEDMLTILTSEKYVAAAEFSHFILLGSLFLGMNSILRAGLYLKKDTVSILAIMFGSLALNFVLNIFMIPKYGITGAAVAQLITCTTAALLTIFLSFRHIFIKVDFKAVLYYLSLSIIMYFLVSRIATPFLALTLFAKIFAGAALISAGVLFREKEVTAALRLMLPIKRRA